MEKSVKYDKTERKDRIMAWLKERRAEAAPLPRQFFYRCFLPSLLCSIFVELCSRRSFADVALYFLRDPFVFLYNVLIIAATASISLLFRRRAFVLGIVMLLWAAVGVTDLVLLTFRTTPFTAVDLLMIKNALQIMDRYLNVGQIIVIVLALVGAVCLLVFVFRKAKREQTPIPYLVRVPFCLLSVAVCLLLTQVGLSTKLLDRNFGNLAQAFHENGLPYCFACSVLSTGISRPSSYSSETIDAVLEDVLGQEEKENPYPNLIFLQLESFFDPKLIENIQFTEDPVPYFTYLKENYSSGFLSVPSVGAGTANTEFELITGMNLDFFGPGEYPYKTLLRTRTCESMAYVLRELGYSATAIHNNDGTFYGRNEVFSSLGFDRFVPVEYMSHVEMTPLGWAKDRVLTEELLKVLEATPEKDYIYAISVQGHGAYPSEPVLANPAVDVRLPEELSDYYYGYLYYVNQLREMDLFLRELLLELEAYSEDVVLVLYGDHLPSLGLSEELLENRNLFQTQYVLWSNFPLERRETDLEAYQLAAYVEERLQMHQGLMMRYHQKRQGDEDYLEKMQVLMYDMLYGDLEVYGGENPYEPTELSMGVAPIAITRVFAKESAADARERILYVKGENFTEWSVLAIDGKQVETIFLNETLLATKELPRREEFDVTVRQQGSDGIILGETSPAHCAP